MDTKTKLDTAHSTFLAAQAADDAHRRKSEAAARGERGPLTAVEEAQAHAAFVALVKAEGDYAALLPQMQPESREPESTYRRIV